jgi:nucleoid-associated protein YgaU
MVRLMRCAALAVADVGVLVGFRPHLALIGHLRAPHRWLAEVGSDAAVAELADAALWLAAAWLAVGLAAASAAALPGVAGRICGHIAGAVLPRALYKIVAGAAGIGVLMSPVLAGAVAPGVSGGNPAGSNRTQANAPLPTPAWPSIDSLPAPVWPSSPPTSTTPPTAAPSLDASRAQRSGAVVVRPGDSLWRIAADRLAANPSDQRIAAVWPRWYALNRSVVGNNPDHIVPGQVLHVPDEENPS